MDRDRVRLAVYQYLVEQGYDVAAMALQDALGGPDSVREAHGEAAGQLLNMLDELVLLREKLAPARKPKPRLDKEELQPDNSFCSSEFACLQERHNGNVLACRLSASGLLVTSAADRTLGLTRLEGMPEAALPDDKTTKLPMDCPILGVDIHSTKQLLLIAGMDGTTSVLDFEGNEVQAGPRHGKYAVRAVWSPCGKYFATASYDKTAELWGWDGDQNAYARLRRFHFEGNVESVVFAPPQPPSAQENGGPSEESHASATEASEENGEQSACRGQLLICARGEYRVHVYDIAADTTDYINMNELHDDYVSFSAMDASVSPDGKYVLVATDKDRVILLSRMHKCLLTVFYGASNDRYSNPRCCWHPSGAYVYASSQTHEVLVWETATQRLVHRLQGHTKAIRDMHMCAPHNMLVTGSYDKTIRVWGVEE